MGARGRGRWGLDPDDFAYLCERSIVRRITQKLYRSSSPLGVTAGDHHVKLLCTECRLIKEPGIAEPLAKQMETDGGEFSRRMWKLLDRPTRPP
ncbi:LOW QUALITY PROTEIN: hypothetical protein N5P37_002359 [Trichoderma harzianum]|nr:LOW QUALITY PROTEIN: hypothetical protein N5P37_002359 [Trichoderma harzianum]